MISLKRIAVGVLLGVGALWFIGAQATTRSDVDEIKPTACSMVLAEVSAGHMTKHEGAARWSAMGCHK